MKRDKQYKLTMGLDAANRKGSFARPTIEIYITRMACRNMFLYIFVFCLIWKGKMAVTVGTPRIY